MSDFKILPGVFKNSRDGDLCFAFVKGNLIVKRAGENLSIPRFSEIKELNIQYENEFFLGQYESENCFVVQISSNIEIVEKFKLLPLREVGILMKREIFLIAGRASEILNWNRNNKYCGRCGSKTESKKDEMAKVCPNCGNIMYPVICPAIIVAITKGDKILLAHNSSFKNNMYGLIAGFVEAGESLEHAVRREIFEEVNIKVNNIRYYASSPWPFPNSLMLGFFAEYDSGKLKVDGSEIVDADWFTKDELPNIPKKFSLARMLIDEFIKL